MTSFEFLPPAEPVTCPQCGKPVQYYDSTHETIDVTTMSAKRRVLIILRCAERGQP